MVNQMVTWVHCNRDRIHFRWQSICTIKDLLLWHNCQTPPKGILSSLIHLAWQHFQNAFNIPVTMNSFIFFSDSFISFLSFLHRSFTNICSIFLRFHFHLCAIIYRIALKWKRRTPHIHIHSRTATIAWHQSTLYHSCNTFWKNQHSDSIWNVTNK